MKSSPLILTVSYFSRAELEKYYPAAKGKVEVVPNAWQHIERVEADPSTLERHSLVAGQYYFAMSSLAPNKNLKWIVQTAKLNPDSIFAVAGGINSRVFGEHDIPEADNVKYLGYVNDSEAKALMAGCKAFLYPTFYEGFGLPPMEAMASGAPAVIVSDNPCMHEVYGDSVTYIDPYKPQANLDSCLTNTPSVTAEDILARYSWRGSAEKILDILRKVS